MSGLTSPVKAPESSTAQFWAPERHRDPLGLQDRLDGAQVGERWVDRDVEMGDVGRLQPQAQVTRGMEGLVVIEVHLPVAADERAGDRAAASLTVPPPGRVGRGVGAPEGGQPG